MIGHLDTVRCLQVDDDKVVSGSYDKTLKIWDISSGHCRLTLRYSSLLACELVHVVNREL
jgi:F-box/WD-40 domain protein 7